MRGFNQTEVRINGCTLYCEMLGEGEPLVLVHGGGGDRRHWDRQFEALATHYRVIRYDMRGFGRSANPVEGVAYRHQDDLRMLLEQLGISSAHIAGYSLGCQVVIDSYTVHPEIFQSIIAVGPWISGYSSPAGDSLMSSYGKCVDIFNQKGAVATAEYFVGIPEFKPDRILPEAREHIYQLGIEYGWWFASHMDPVEAVTPTGFEALGNIKVPLLIITAEHDATACREVAGLLSREVPGSRMLDIAGASHFMLLEKPEEFNRAIDEFLTVSS